MLSPYLSPYGVPSAPLTWPSQDLLDAFAYFKANANAWGMDASRVLLFGESAGGGLAVLTAYRANDPGIRGVFNLYGFTELEYYWNHTRGMYPDPFVRYGMLNDVTIPKLREASASTYVTPNTPPTITLHGTWDTIVPYSQSTYLHSVLDKHGVKNMLIDLPTYQHSLDGGWYSVGGQVAKYILERFAASVLLNA